MSFNIKLDKNKKHLAKGSAPEVKVTRKKGKAQREFILHAEKSIAFKSFKGKVVFSADHSVKKNLKISKDPAEILKERKHKLFKEINLQKHENYVFSSLEWDYLFNTKIKGNPGFKKNLYTSFGFENKRTALYQIIRTLNKDKSDEKKAHETINSWILPSNIASYRDIQPGTVIITELEGSFSADLSVKYNFDFTWLKENYLKKLSGDIDLAVKSGLKAKARFKSGSRYILIMQRDLNKGNILRTMLFDYSGRESEAQFQLALNVTTDPDDKIFEKRNNLLSAIFGVSTSQIIKDLEFLKRWTDPALPLPDLFADAGIDYINDFLREVTGFDPEENFNKAHKCIEEFFEIWDSLPHKALSILLDFLDNSTDTDLKNFRKLLKDFSNAERADIKAKITDLMERGDFFENELGQWLETLFISPLIHVINDSDEIRKLKVYAEKTYKLLSLEHYEKLLRKLLGFIDDKLSLDKVREINSRADFEKLDKLIKKKLSLFFCKNIEFSDLDSIRKVINKILNKQDEILNQASESLKNKFSFELSTGFKKSRKSEALLDLEFDFSSNKRELDNTLRNIIHGDFNDIFCRNIRGLKIKKGVLTHKVKRQSSVKVRLPFLKYSRESVNSTFAKLSLTGSSSDILFYSLNSKDIFTSQGRDVWSVNSTLVLKAGIRRAKNSAISDFSSKKNSLNYTFRQFFINMKTGEFENQLKPYMIKYFPGVFGVNCEKLGDWAIYTDKYTDRINNNGSGNLGSVIIEMTVSIDDKTVKEWFNASSDKNSSVYRKMSAHIQRALREVIPLYYFQDYKKFIKNKNRSFSILAYSVMPPLESSDSVFWKGWSDKRERDSLVRHTVKSPPFLLRIGEIYNELVSRGERDAEFYRPDQITINDIIFYLTEKEDYFYDLFYVENMLIQNACKAGVRLSGFADKADSDPVKALEILTEFGETITETFNSKLINICTGDLLKPLGTYIFTRAAHAFINETDITVPKASLKIIVLKDENSFSHSKFIKNKKPVKEDIVLEKYFFR